MCSVYVNAFVFFLNSYSCVSPEILQSKTYHQEVLGLIF